MARSRLPLGLRLHIIGLLAVLSLSFLTVVQAQPPAKPADKNAGPTEFFFCFWNVENLFDDKDDKRRDVDEEFDDPFAANGKMRQEKLDHLADILLKMNDGNGPDIIACVEVESVRAADLLRATLNKRLEEAKADPKLKYTQVAMKNLDAGRHIAPCVITRLNVAHAFTKLHGRDLRILESRLMVNGHELCIVASHWTSQLKQDNGGNGDLGRNKYADAIFEVFAAANKKSIHTDFLVCGDFNDTPDAKPIFGNLGAVPDAKRVVPTEKEPLFLNLMGGKDPNRFGTIWYNNKPLIYDHICVSPGMLDGDGWSVRPETVSVVTEGLIRGTRREPWRFGNPNSAPIGGRGYSDHFPVTVKLKVQPKK